ncbi:MAG: copper-binding protein [Thiobacillus sp.]|jgi:Cu/Ag efflux protein CusF|nr:copper-binding protein [Thiobacillus sp.]
MKRSLSTLILVMTLPLGLPALADMNHMSHGSGSAHAAMGDMMSEGTVKKVDKAQGKLTIKHGQLANLDMPPMTMIFRVKDPAMLDQVKPGDNVHFRADRMNGMLTVTRIETVK